MQILKRTGIDWRERRLISKLYMDQKVKDPDIIKKNYEITA